MISPFEYIVVLISIILGMGITQVLSGTANIVSRWDQVTLYWPHTIWIVLVFVFHFQEWWVTYELRTYEYWRLPVFLFIILYPMNLYILARLLFPIRWSKESISFKEYYFANCRKLFLLVFTLSVLSVLQNLIIGGAALSEEYLQSIVASLSFVVVIFNVRKAWVHEAIAAVLLLAAIASFAVQWNTLLIVNT